MTTSFPTSLDNFTNPAGSDLTSTPVGGATHSGQHDNLNDAVEALEAKVGINSSGVTTSLDNQMGTVFPLAHSQTHADTSHTGANKHGIWKGGSLLANEAVSDYRNGMEIVNSAGIKNEFRPPPYIVPMNGMGTFGTTPGLGGNARTSPAVFGGTSGVIRMYVGAFTMIRFELGLSAAFSTASGAGVCNIFPQYSTDNSTWNPIENSGTGLDLDGSTTGFKDSGWVTMASGVTAANGTSGSPAFEMGVYFRIGAYGTGTGAAGAMRYCWLVFV
jgi:hypothetical protein